MKSYLFLKFIFIFIFGITIGLYLARWVLPPSLYSDFYNVKSEDLKSAIDSKENFRIPNTVHRKVYRANFSAFLGINTTTEVRNGKVPYLSPTYFIPVRVEKLVKPSVQCQKKRGKTVGPDPDRTDRNDSE